MVKNQGTEIVVRSVSNGESAALWALAGKLGLAKDVDYFERCLYLQGEGKREVFVATYSGEDCAYCILNWEPKYGLYKKLNIPEIQDLNVLQVMRQRGIGTALIQYCEDMARKNGYEEIGISVGLHSTAGPAQKLYIKLGYTPDGTGVTYDRQHVAFGEFRPVDDNLCLMMIKPLR